MADVGQTGVSGEQMCYFKFDLMSYNKTVNDFQIWWIQGLINPWNMIFTSDASVNIMFHRLINPCIHLMESHQLYNIFHIRLPEICHLQSIALKQQAQWKIIRRSQLCTKCIKISTPTMLNCIHKILPVCWIVLKKYHKI
jgi:hypothetical protein